MADQADEVALAVADEPLPLRRSCGPERVVGMGEDHVRLCLDVHAVRSQLLDPLPDRVDLEVQRRLEGTPFEQEPDPAEVEEEQSRGLEPSGRLAAGQAGVELRRPVEVLGMLCHLHDVHATPLSHMQAGVDSMATAIDNSLNNHHVAELPSWLQALLAIALCVGIALWVLQLPKTLPRRGC